MELTRGSLIFGTMIALGLGAGAAWWTRPETQPQPHPAASASPVLADEKPARLYKWQDDAGVWNYTDQPPAGRSYEEVRGTPNVTSVPTVVPELPTTQADSSIPPPPAD